MFESTVSQFSDRINDFLINAVWKLAQDLDFGEIEIELRNLLSGSIIKNNLNKLDGYAIFLLD